VISDADLCLAAQSGDTQAADQLVRRHLQLARNITRGLYIQGADQDDLHQEAMIALYVAIVSYRRTLNATFEGFAATVIRRRVASAMTAGRAGKHAILTRAHRQVRLDGSDRSDDVASISLIPDISPGPAERVEAHEQLNMLVALSRSLTEVERRSLVGIVNGHSYREIAVENGVSEKTVDNAAVRARVKLRSLLEAA